MMFGRGFGFGGHMFGYPFFGGFMGLAGFLLTVVFIALLIRFAMRAAHGHAGYGTHHCGRFVEYGEAPTAPGAPVAGASDEAVAIARRRLATGEITGEQYAEIIEHLAR